MLVSIIPHAGEIKPLMDHTDGNYLGYKYECGAILVENPLTEMVYKDKPYGNTCIAVQNLLLNKNLREAFNANLGTVVSPVVSQLFGFFNGTEFSELIEVHYSDRFMNNEVGPIVGFVTGVGIKAPSDIMLSVPQLEKLKVMLTAMDYRGEVGIGLSEQYVMTGVYFGHLYGHFALYSEICKNSVQNILDFIFGAFPKLELYDGIAIANMISQPPYPNIMETTSGSINAPKGAEKHLWRIILGGVLEATLTVVHGTYLGEARKRLRRTIDNMLRYCDTIQYRTDYGYNAKFVLNKEKYEEYCKSPYKEKEGLAVVK